MLRSNNSKLLMSNHLLGLSSFALVTLLLLTCCGCGGASNSSSPPGGISLPPPVATPAQVAPRPVKRKVTKKETKKVEAQVVDPTSNDYEITTPSGVTVISPEDVPEQNFYAVIKPVNDSTLLSVSLPEEAALSDNVRSEIQLKLPTGFAIAPNSKINDQGYPTKILCEGDGAEMVFVDGGVFTRGSNSGPAEVQPEQAVFISPFYMDSHEVTLMQFLKFRTEFNETAAKAEKVSAPGNASQQGNYPALKIVWRDAENYAKEYGKALPTEAEWERAARGIQSHQHPWGNGRPLSSSTSLEEILPIVSRPTDLTPTGLYDMAGNAREWTSDWFSAKLYEKQATEDGSLIRNPVGPRLPDKLGEKSTRGSQGTWKLWMRSHANLRESGDKVGFRCILRITDEMTGE